MTVEKALSILDNMYKYYNDYIGYDGYEGFSKDDNEAFVMAYNALAQEPSIKTGHWIYKIYGGFHEQGNWYCSHCDYQYNYGDGHAKFCPECGYEMSEPSTEEVIRDRDYDWIIKR